MHIVAFSGSTRNASFNSHLLSLAIEAATRGGARITRVVLRDLDVPLYDGDLEDAHGVPAPILRLREQIEGADALMIATPEYNGSLSAVLKNTIDWISRPVAGGRPGTSFTGKPALLMSASPSKAGGKNSLAHLDFIITRLGGKVLPTKISVPLADQTLEHPSAELIAQIEAGVQELLALQPAAAQ